MGRYADTDGAIDQLVTRRGKQDPKSLFGCNESYCGKFASSWSRALDPRSGQPRRSPMGAAYGSGCATDGATRMVAVNGGRLQALA